MKKSKNLLLLLLAMLSAVWGAGLSWSWEFPVGESRPEAELPHAQAYQITDDIVHSARSQPHSRKGSIPRNPIRTTTLSAARTLFTLRSL